MKKAEIFDPETNDEHPIPISVESTAIIAGVPNRTCYAIYLTLDFASGAMQYTAGEMADAIAGLWDDPRNPGHGDRQDVAVYRCKS